jgi:hypothetical protein
VGLKVVVLGHGMLHLCGPRPSRPSWRRSPWAGRACTRTRATRPGRSKAEDGRDRLFCFAMQSPRGAAENSRSSPLPARLVHGPIALSKAEARSSSDGWGIREHGDEPRHTFPCRLCRRAQEAGHVLRGELYPDLCPKRLHAELPEIVVEVLEPRRQGDCLDPARVRPFDETVPRPVACRIVVAKDIEPSQRVWEQD